jgi:putative ABC transport system substrate-binding protein
MASTLLPVLGPPCEDTSVTSSGAGRAPIGPQFDRRCAIAVGLAIAVRPFGLGAQPRRMYRILWLSTASNPDPLVDSFREGLRSHGLVDGTDVSLELRYAIGNPAGLRAGAEELARGNYDLVVSSGPAIRAARLIKDLPVLFSISGDPVELGIARSLARPGGNFTGATFLSLDLAAKRVELSKELLPGIRKLAILSNTEHPGERSEWQATQAAAQTMGIDLSYAPFQGDRELDRALAMVRDAGADAMLVFPDGVTMVHRVRLARFAVDNRLPSMFGWSEYCNAGGLMSYGANQRATYYRLAGYAVRMLRGEKAADLPVEQPTRFELTVNLKTARSLGMEIPARLLARADEVIE